MYIVFSKNALMGKQTILPRSKFKNNLRKRMIKCVSLTWRAVAVDRQTYTFI